MHSLQKIALGFSLLCAAVLPARADSDVYLLGVPDYTWYAGCFGTGCGNLMGYWDRNGLPDLYTGPTAGGVAPLDSFGANVGIRSMWASKAGFDGRPADKFGHIDDYWAYYGNDYSYESTADDPYVLKGRPEHAPDCVGDFIGLSQKKWTNLSGECDGNIDAFSFVYWDSTGNRRTNYTPGTAAGSPARDIQSGLREWMRYIGYEADVFTQLVEFNPATPPGKGFTFEDLKAEINAGYPVLIFLQNYNQTYRSLAGMSRANPEIHGMLAIGYQEFPEFGIKSVRVRTSWGPGNQDIYPWDTSPWVAFSDPVLNVRGVICFHPHPKVRTFARAGGEMTMTWDAPASQLFDATTSATTTVHRYQVERSTAMLPGTWSAVGSPTTSRSTSFTEAGGGPAFFRVRLLHPGE